MPKRVISFVMLLSFLISIFLSYQAFSYSDKVLKDISIFVTKVERLDNNQYKATWGYENPNKSTIMLPKGHSKLFGDIKRGDCIYRFEPGKHATAFSTLFTGDRVIWEIKNISGKEKRAIAYKEAANLDFNSSLISINFQPYIKGQNNILIEGFIPDSGEVFSNQFGLDFGFEKKAKTLRDNACKDPLVGTGVILEHNNKWQIKLPNGAYDVVISVGTTNKDTCNTVIVEGQEFCLNLKLERGEFQQIKKRVILNGEYLTLSTSFHGHSKTVLNYIQIFSKKVCGISLEPKEMEIEIGESLYLFAKVIPEWADNQEVIFSSENPSIAEIDQKGMVTGVAAGTTNIIAQTKDGGYKAVCKVTVVESGVPYQISFAKTRLDVEIGKSRKIEYIIEPEGYKGKIEWISLNPNIAEVDSQGNVKGVSVGETRVKANLPETGSFDVCRIVVHDKYPYPFVLMADSVYGDVYLEWDEICNAEYYVVKRKAETEENYKEIAKTKNTSFVDTTCYEDGRYYYVVYAYNSFGESHSNEEIVDVRNLDSDFDGINDKKENMQGLNPKVQDSDRDGLEDSYETELGTNPLSKDSDNDGLSDYFELEISKTDPLISDSDSDGIIDSKEDFDNDKLDNLSEEKTFTSPIFSDTDFDGISDYDEIFISKTNPIKVDTDQDGLFDKTEVDSGLNPLSKDSDGNGVIDGEESIYQVVAGERLRSVNQNGQVVFGLKIKAKGEIVNSVVVQKVYNSSTFFANGFIVGEPFKIECFELFEVAQLQFRLNDTVLEGDQLSHFAVVCYDTKGGKFSLPKATYNESSKTITVETNHFSVYYLINLKKYLDITGLKSGTVSPSGQADIVFVIDTTGSMSDEIDAVKQNINNFVDKLKTKDISVNLGLVTYKDITCDGQNSTVGHGFFSSVDDFKNALGSIKVDGGGDTPETLIDALETARLLGFRENSTKFIVVLTDANYKLENRFGIKSADEIIERLKSDNIIVSVVSPTSFEELYFAFSSQTKGIFADIYSDFSSTLEKLIDLANQYVNDGSWIVLSNLDIIKLKKAPDLNDSVTDTDGDGLADSEELKNSQKITLELPWDGLLKNLEIWDFVSYPTKVDSDEDGLSDYDEVLKYKTSPIDYDTDCDLLSDLEEIEAGTNPVVVDSDEDGLSDSVEFYLFPGDEAFDPNTETTLWGCDYEEALLYLREELPLYVKRNTVEDVILTTIYSLYKKQQTLNNSRKRSKVTMLNKNIVFCSRNDEKLLIEPDEELIICEGSTIYVNSKYPELFKVYGSLKIGGPNKKTYVKIGNPNNSSKSNTLKAIREYTSRMTIFAVVAPMECGNQPRCEITNIELSSFAGFLSIGHKGYVKIDGCTLKNVKTGVYVSPVCSPQGSQLLISNTTFHSCSTAGLWLCANIKPVKINKSIFYSASVIVDSKDANLRFDECIFENCNNSKDEPAFRTLQRGSKNILFLSCAFRNNSIGIHAYYHKTIVFINDCVFEGHKYCSILRQVNPKVIVDRHTRFLETIEPIVKFEGASTSETLFSAILGLLDPCGIKDIIEILAGEDIITGEEIPGIEKVERLLFLTLNANDIRRADDIEKWLKYLDEIEKNSSKEFRDSVAKYSPEFAEKICRKLSDSEISAAGRLYNKIGEFFTQGLNIYIDSHYKKLMELSEEYGREAIYLSIHEGLENAERRLAVIFKNTREIKNKEDLVYFINSGDELAKSLGVSAFKESNYRDCLYKYLGIDNIKDLANKAYQVHHIFPQSLFGEGGLYESIFKREGLNVYDVRFLGLWDAKGHLKKKYDYNREWLEEMRKLLRKHGDRIEDIDIIEVIEKGREIADRYGFTRVRF